MRRLDSTSKEEGDGASRIQLTLRENFVFASVPKATRSIRDGGDGQSTGKDRQPEHVRGSGPSGLRR